MKSNFFFLILILPLTACNNSNQQKISVNKNATSAFADARRTFVTRITRQMVNGAAPEKPPKGLFNLVEYPSNIGNMSAYVTPIPQDGKPRPAIIWIIGGFGNSLENTPWVPLDPANDQSASEFRKAGIIEMYPSERGGNLNPGYDECFYGEIDDIVCAAEYLAKQPGIDPNRIYLGGHSTGGTKTLLAAECSDIFRATFSVSGIAAAFGYGPEHITFDTTNFEEFKMRWPIRWLSSIRKPVFLFDGSIESNADEMHKLQDSAEAENVMLAHFYEIKHADHFTICQPLCKMIAQKILADTIDNDFNIGFDEAQLNTDFDKLTGWK